MAILVRQVLPEDADACGRAAYEAHTTVAAAHNLPSEHPSVEFSIGLIKAKVSDPNVYGCVAVQDGRIVGSVFLNTFPPEPVAAIGPLTVFPSAEGRTGRQLMEAALAEARRRGLERVRLVQSPSHLRSLVLYAKLGFTVREPLILFQGTPPAARLPSEHHVRPTTPDDLARCNTLCAGVHGFARDFELSDAIRQNVALVVERSGRLTGYAAGLGLRGHAVAETTEDLKTLISSAPRILGPGFFVPIRNGELFRWLLEAGLRAAWPANLMTLGPYQEPAGAYLPAIAF